jgi:arginase family enzyme
MSDYNQPLSGNEMPRFAGTATMFRLPVALDPSSVDVGIVGVPLDIGTSNRVGARYGPRQIRAESVLILSMLPILVMSPSIPITLRNRSTSSNTTLMSCCSRI